MGLVTINYFLHPSRVKKIHGAGMLITHCREPIRPKSDDEVRIHPLNLCSLFLQHYAVVTVWLFDCQQLHMLVTTQAKDDLGDLLPCLNQCSAVLSTIAVEITADQNGVCAV